MGAIADFLGGPDVVIAIVKVVVAFVALLVATLLTIWFERKVIADMQSRIGPNRWGPFGILQSLADGIKLFFKEDVRPRYADRWTYGLAPVMAAVPSFLAFAVIPFGDHVTVGGERIGFIVSDLNIGLLFFLAAGSIGVYGVVLAGWASGSKYPLLGGVRSTAQLISYELALGLAVAAVFVYADTLQVSEIVANQRTPLFELGPVSIPAWHVIPMLPAFVIFFITAVAETQRPPFDLPEAEGELVAGFHTEYSGAKFAMIFLAEFMNVITMSAVMVTVFFGGPGGPLPAEDAGGLLAVARAVLPTVYFVIKVAAFLFVFVWLRATLPRMRYDRLMDLGWKVMLPLGQHHPQQTEGQHHLPAQVHEPVIAHARQGGSEPHEDEQESGDLDHEVDGGKDGSGDGQQAAGVLGRQRSARTAEEHGHHDRRHRDHVHELGEEDHGELGAGVLGVEAADQLPLGLRQVEGRALRLGDRGDEEQHERGRHGDDVPGGQEA